MKIGARALGAAYLSLLCGACSAPPEEQQNQETGPVGIEAATLQRLRALAPVELPAAPPDLSNQYADDPRAAELGQKLFFDTRFSGPLLESDNQGGIETLGVQGETGKVGCIGCHIPTSGFLDNRSPRRQISLAAGWTRRRAPSLLDVGQATLLMWDGRRDAAFNQVFNPIESPLEFNSSPLFVAQQIARYYKADYEAIFGSMPSLDAYEVLDAANAGCTELPADQVNDHCVKPTDDDILRIVVNMGKAISAYTRLLTCGATRFDDWMNGDAMALNAEEQAGAVVFVKSGCDFCHSGPFMSDFKFHNVGAANLRANFIEPYDDPGASAGIEAMRADPLNSLGKFSDGDDGRLDSLNQAPSEYIGAFKTPKLRCVAGRPSLMHAGQQRTLDDMVLFFNRGGDSMGYQGVKDPLIVQLGLSDEDRKALIAFLRALDGPGPDAALLTAPALPQ